MLNAKAKFAAIAVLGFPILVAGVIFGPAAFNLIFHRRPPERYIVPAEFTGWARIAYGQSGASPLPVENGRRILILDGHGKLATSDLPISGHAKDEFFAATASGLQALPYVGACKGGMIWGLETFPDDGSGKPSTRFFVGTEYQYRRAIDPGGKNSPSC
jgi:hypothetical protein